MPTRRSLLAALSAGGLAGAAGCGSRLPGDGTDGTDRAGGSGASAPTVTPTPPSGASGYRYTHPRPTGNRALADGGDVRGADPVRIDVDGRPRWLVAGPDGAGGSRWIVVAADGRATRWRVADGTATVVGRYPSVDPARPPVVALDDEADGPGEVRLVRPPPGSARFAPPAVAPGADGRGPTLLYAAADGDLVVAGGSVDRFAVDCPPDARLAAVGDGRYVLYGDATGRYRHGALGDTTEGSSLVVVDPAAPAVVARTAVGPPETFEGIQPMAADLDADGAPEVVTTVADSANGARIAAFDADGTRVATGPVHAPGWRHQLAVAPFGPDGRPELAVVRKPHVEHVLEFYRLRGGSLRVVATAEGFSSHTYGSRIVGGAVAADLDADGATEALVPTTARDELAAVRRDPDGAAVVWRKPLGGALRTNVTGVALADGRAAVGAGTDDGVRVWQG